MCRRLLSAPVDLEIDGLADAEQIGAGGNAVVYRARQVDLERWVAVKMLRLGDEDSRRRFDRERKVMARISNHPNIAPIYFSGFNAKGEPYLVMPFYPDGSLDEAGPMGWKQACELIIDVAGAVQHAHDHHVMHRDLKPANIMLDGAGRPIVVDFGIAQLISGTQSLSQAITLTPSYAPPEAFDGPTTDVRSDVYSLGATLHGLIGGRPPFDTGDAGLLAALGRIANEPPPDLRDRAPAELCELIELAMAKAIDDRPADAAAFRDALVETIQEELRSAPPTKRQRTPEPSVATEVPGADKRSSAATEIVEGAASTTVRDSSDPSEPTATTPDAVTQHLTSEPSGHLSPTAQSTGADTEVDPSVAVDPAPALIAVSAPRTVAAAESMGGQGIEVAPGTDEATSQLSTRRGALWGGLASSIIAVATGLALVRWAPHTTDFINWDFPHGEDGYGAEIIGGELAILSACAGLVLVVVACAARLWSESRQRVVATGLAISSAIVATLIVRSVVSGIDLAYRESYTTELRLAMALLSGATVFVPLVMARYADRRIPHIAGAVVIAGLAFGNALLGGTAPAFDDADLAGRSVEACGGSLDLSGVVVLFEGPGVFAGELGYRGDERLAEISANLSALDTSQPTARPLMVVASCDNLAAYRRADTVALPPAVRVEGLPDLGGVGIYLDGALASVHEDHTFAARCLQEQVSWEICTSGT